MRKFALTVFAFALLAAPFGAMHASSWSYYYRTSGIVGPTELTMVSGSTLDVTLRATNRGYYRWRGGSGWRYVSLYATSPYARKSVFAHSSWRSSIQPAALWEYRVEPGETGSFRFTLQAPTTPGTYHEQFTMAVEDTVWIDGGVVNFTITVVPEERADEASVGAVGAKAYVVMDAETGEILEEKDADDIRSIASLTKLMTTMVALEDVGVNQNQPVSLLAVDEVGGARLRVSTGSTWSVGNLLASTLIGSTNNTAHALARSTGLPMSAFVQKMNERARRMGLTNTRFADPTGIEVGNVSTAKEVARMALTAFKHPMIRFLASRSSYTLTTSDYTGYRTISNTNGLLGDDSFQVVAGKTGYLIEAGWTLATQVKKPGERELMIVVLGCSDRYQSFADVKNLANSVWNKS